MSNKIIEVLVVSFFVVSILFFYLVFEPTSKDLRPCLNQVGTEAKALSANQKESNLDLRQQCREIEPLLASFDQCLDGVRNKHGSWATETVFRMASVPFGADRKFKEIKITCSDYLIFLKGLP